MRAAGTASPPPATAAPASAPSVAPSSVYERPPEGLARGRWEASPWHVAAVAAGLIAVVVAFLVIRRRRARARSAYESIAPASSRR